MNRAIVSTLVLILAVAFYFWYVQSNTQSLPIVDEKILVNESGINQDTLKQSSILKDFKPESQSVKSENQVCITQEDYLKSGEIVKVAAWHDSWGVPHDSVDLNGVIYREEHIYRHVENEELLVQASTGDMQANYALGLNKIWEGMTGNKSSPLLSNNPDNFKRDLFLDKPNHELLEEGRKYLLESVAAGNIYAYIEIAFSYVYELSKIKHELSEEEINQIEKKIALYGKMPNYLIKELRKNYFQSAYLAKKGAIKIMLPLWEKEAKRMSNYRTINSYQPLKISPKSDYFQEPVFCTE